MLAGCVIPQDAAFIDAVTISDDVPGSHIIWAALPDDCQLQWDPEGTFCDFEIAGRSLRIVLDGFASDPEITAAARASATQGGRPILRTYLESSYESFLDYAQEYDRKVIESSFYFDAGLVKISGFDECLRYFRSFDYGAFSSEGKGAICASRIEGSDRFWVVHLAYMERRVLGSSQTSTFDAEAEAVLTSLRYLPEPD
jgi:hypothetical protein